MRTNPRSSKIAFTLIELLVVVAIIALLLSILLPALSRTRDQGKSVKCLSNLRTLGQGVMVYAAEEMGRLPGPLHPAVYRNQGTDALMEAGLSYAQARWAQERFLTWKLRKAFNDSGSQKDSVSDQVSTCPTTVGLNPDSNFDLFYQMTSKRAYPTDYVLNNVGTNSEQGTHTDGLRTTNPPQYFGFSSYDKNNPTLAALEKKYPPLPLEQIKRPSEEWMIADAWYRSKVGPIPQFQQEGPYQWAWTGESLPHFAPHFAKGWKTYQFPGSNQRDQEAAMIRVGRQDGKTNTVFFDGHAEPVRSMRLLINQFEILYGFPGTVNPTVPLAQYQAGWSY